MQKAFNDGRVELIAKDCLAGWGFGIKYFDDDKRVYISPETQQDFLDKKLERLDFVTLVYRKGERTIEEVVEEIREVVQDAHEGEMTPHMLEQHIADHAKKDAERVRTRHERVKKAILDKEAGKS